MFSGIIYWWPIFLVLLSGCSCGKWGGGFKVSGQSQLDLTAGTTGSISSVNNDGFRVVIDGDTVLGANWKGGAYGGMHSNVNNEYHTVDRRVSGELEGVIQPGFHIEFGRDSQGNWHQEIKPRMAISTNKKFTGNRNSAEEDATTLASVYRDEEAVIDETTTATAE